MEFNNIFIFILIFIVLMTLFYFIINNIGIKNNNTDSNINELEKKISNLSFELLNMKLKENVKLPIQSESDAMKEIIIESDEPTVGKINETNKNYILPSRQPPQPQQPQQPPIIYDPIANYDIAKLSDPLVDPRGRTSADQIPTPQVAAQFNFPTQGVLDRYHRVGLLIAIGSNVKNELNNDIIWEGHINKSNKINRKNNLKKLSKYTYDDNSSKSYKGIEIKENFDTDSDSDFNDSIEEFNSKNSNKIVNVYNNYSNQNDNSILELIGKKITDNWYKYFTSITMGNKIIKVVIRNNNRRELYTGDVVFVPEIGKSYRVKIDPMDMIEYNPYMF